MDIYLTKKIKIFYAILGGGCLNEQAMGDLIKIAISTLNEHFERQAERLKKRNDEDYDEGVEEQLVEEDDEDTYTLSKLGDLVHALFAAYKEAFLPCFEQLLPYATKLLVRNSKIIFQNFYIFKILQFSKFFNFLNSSISKILRFSKFFDFQDSSIS